MVTDPARSPLLERRSIALRFERFAVPLTRAKATGAKLGGSVNDVYVTGIAGALGLYHERMGVPCDELRMAMPISTRGGDEESANSFTRRRVLVPVTPKDPAARFKLVHERLHGLRDEPAVTAAGSLAGLLTALPTSMLVALTRTQAHTIDFATSNLQGSPVDLYLGGVRIEANYPIGPARGVRAQRHIVELPRLARHGDQHRPCGRERPGNDDRLHRRVVRRPARRRRHLAEGADGLPPLRRGATNAGHFLDGLAPFGEAGIEPLVVLALGDEILDVDVQRRRFLGQLDEVGGAGVERTTLEHVEHRDHRQDPAAARRARRHRRRLQRVGQTEQQDRLGGVEEHPVAVVVDEGQGALGGVVVGEGHHREGSALRARPLLGPVCPGQSAGAGAAA